MKFLSLGLIAASAVLVSAASTVDVTHLNVVANSVVKDVANEVEVTNNAQSPRVSVLKRKVTADAISRRISRRHSENEADENEADENENEADENENEADENENEVDEEEEDENEVNESSASSILRRAEADEDENEENEDETDEDENEAEENEGGESELKRRDTGSLIGGPLVNNVLAGGDNNDSEGDSQGLLQGLGL